MNDGYYWFLENGEEPCIVLVKTSFGVHWVWFCGDDQEENLVGMQSRGRFVGPLVFDVETGEKV